MSESASSCAQCGCDRIDPSSYGVARMLRDAGVDRIALPERVRTLDARTRDRLEGQWDAQRELVRALREDAVTAAASLPAQEELFALVDDELARAIPIAPAHLDALRFKERPASAARAPSSAQPPASYVDVASGAADRAGAMPRAPGPRDAPTSPPRPFSEERLVQLELVRQHHPTSRVRQIATLALAREGGATRDVVNELVTLMSEDTVVGALAAVILLGWRMRRAHLAPRPGSKSFDEALRQALTRARAIEPLAAEAAIALVALTPNARGVLEEPLRAALASSDLDVRLGAALALDDERALARILDDDTRKGDAGDDDTRKDAALDALCALGSALLAPRIAPLGGRDEDAPLPPDGPRVRVLERLGRKLAPALHDAVISCARTGSDRVRDAALRVLMRGRFIDHDAQEQAALAHAVSTHAPDLGAERVLKLLAWVSADTTLEATLRPFVRAAAALLRHEPPELATQDATALRTLLIHAADDELTALDSCVRAAPLATRLDHDPARVVIEAALDLHARRGERHGSPPDRLPMLLARWWALTPRPAAAMSRALAKRRGMSGADDVITFFWGRFCEAPAERRDVIEAVRPWLQRFFEKRDATAPSERPDRGDSVLAWEMWSEADPENMWRLVETLGAQVTDDALSRFVTRVIDAADDVVAARPRTGIVTVFRVAAEVANRFRAQDESAALDDAVRVLKARVPAFLERFRAADARAPKEGSESGAAHFEDDIATELRLIEETTTRRQEAIARVREREERDRERERQRLERERLEREERERRAVEAQRQVEALQASVAGAGGDAPPQGPRLPQPAFEPDSLDLEPYLPGPGPRTLLQYAQLMKALQGGHDALAVFAAFGLDVTTWPACATRWSELMMRDPQVGMRFAQLLSLTWR